MLECMAVDVGLGFFSRLALASNDVRSSRRQRMGQVNGRLPQHRPCMPDRDAHQADRAPVLPELVQEGLIFACFVG